MKPTKFSEERTVSTYLRQTDLKTCEWYLLSTFGSRNISLSASYIPGTVLGINCAKAHKTRTSHSSGRNQHINKWSQYNGLTTTREINNRIKQVTKMPNQMPKRLTRFQWPILRYQVPFLIISSCVSILRGDYITCFWLDFFSQLEKLSEQPIISYIKNFTSSVIFIPIQTTYC